MDFLLSLAGLYHYTLLVHESNTIFLEGSSMRVLMAILLTIGLSLAFTSTQAQEKPGDNKEVTLKGKNHLRQV